MYLRPIAQADFAKASNKQEKPSHGRSSLKLLMSCRLKPSRLSSFGRVVNRAATSHDESGDHMRVAQKYGTQPVQIAQS